MPTFYIQICPKKKQPTHKHSFENDLNHFFFLIFFHSFVYICALSSVMMIKYVLIIIYDLPLKSVPPKVTHEKNYVSATHHSHLHRRRDIPKYYLTKLLGIVLKTV